MRKNTKSAKAESGAINGVSMNGGFRLVDFLVIVIFLSIAAFSINLFRTDLLQTINLKNVEPVGTVMIRKNVIQRRLADRVLWDRLATESPVYLGDLIRVAEVSAATLHIEGSSIDLNENTLIRITRAADGETLKIEMNEGNISVATTDDSGKLSLDINGRQVQPAARTAFSVTSSGNGITLSVNEGSAQFLENGQAREISEGGYVALDSDGSERAEKAAVVIQPVSNARYINDSNKPFTAGFSWNRINLDSGDLLRLEISADRNFSNILYTRETTDSRAQIDLGSGLWYWRLCYAENTVLSEGRFTVADGAGPRLQSPAVSSVFKFTNELPVLNFQWDEVAEASSYILEVSGTPDFSTPQIRRQSQVAFFADSSLGEGTWYWRVMPVFPLVYTGNASFSQNSYFRVERTIIEPASAASSASSTGTEELSLADWLAAEVPPEAAPPVVPPEPAPPPVPPPEPPKLLLTAPAAGTRLEGLTALRQQTVFVWECKAQIVSSRFVLSRNSNPFQGRPATEIQNPGRNITVNSLGEGTWYWNVEARTADGFTVSAAGHGVLRVLGIPLLGAAQNLQPVNGHRFTMSDLMTQRSLSFNWQAVRGANAYIITIYQQTGNSRRQIFLSQPLDSTSYLLEDLRILDKGTFIWQVEAVNRRADNTIDQRGNTAESVFIMDIMLPGTIQIEGTGIIE